MKIRDILTDYPILDEEKYRLHFVSIANRVQVEDLPLIIKYIDRFRLPDFTPSQDNKTLWQHCRYR